MNMSTFTTIQKTLSVFPTPCTWLLPRGRSGRVAARIQHGRPVDPGGLCDPGHREGRGDKGHGGHQEVGELLQGAAPLRHAERLALVQRGRRQQRQGQWC